MGPLSDTQPRASDAPDLCPSPRLPQLAWPAPVEWREECNWAGKDIGVSVGCGWEQEGQYHSTMGSAETEASLFQPRWGQGVEVAESGGSDSGWGLM